MNRDWHHGLRQLGPVLREEATARPGHWAWRQLSRGAVVACRVNMEHHALQFRIARGTKPTLKGRRAWEQELRIFESHLLLHGWQRTIGASGHGGIEALYLSPNYTEAGIPAAAGGMP